MKTTLNAIREHGPCEDGWRKLLSHLGKTKADDETLSIVTILDSNGFDDALWCLRAVEGNDREIRLMAVWFARQVQHLMTDQRSVAVLDVAERYANGEATEAELAAAWGAALDAEGDASTDASSAASSAVWAVRAAWDAVWAARAAARAASAAWGAAWDSQSAELRRVCEEIDAGRDPYPAMRGFIAQRPLE